MFAFKQKILWLILICTFMTALVVGSVSLFMSVRRVQEDSDRELLLRCDRAATDVDHVMAEIRHAVEFGYRQMLDGIHASPEMLDDEAQLRAFTAVMEDRVISQAQYTAGCVAVYIRYDLSLPVDGFFYTRGRRGVLSKRDMTPMERYDPSDVEHVGWYYEPVKAGHAIWTAPYDNKNIDLHMISYVIPIFHEGRTVGVIGMDIDFDYLSHFVLNLKTYNTGYAFATYGETLVIHRDFPFQTPTATTPELAGLAWVHALPSEEQPPIGEYSYEGETKRFARKTLESGINLFLCAPEAEIYADTNDLMQKLVLVIGCSVVVVLLIMNGMLNRFLRLATRDALTGLPNRERFSIFFDREQATPKEYGFFLMDIDRFKRINDTFGHEEGDRVLCRVADALRHIKDGGMVARWGGDEFVGLLPFSEIDARLSMLCEEIAGVEDAVYGRFSVSVGVCAADKKMSLIEMTRLADDGMYRSKQEQGCRVTWM
ncbi:MAG: diguanylate cyclase [Schwartzia sp.]|nr:diguanylate cyclase [Schwartzia sp. (in: firmicutes)]